MAGISLITSLLLVNAAGATQSCIGSPQDNVTFNEPNDNVTFVHPYNISSSTPIGNLTLFIAKQFFIENCGNKTSISLNFFFIERGILATDGMVFPIDDDGALGIGSNRRLWIPQMMNEVTINSTEYSECMSGNTSYFSIPVAFLLLKGPRVIGARRWDIDLLTICSMDVDSFNKTFVTVIADPVEGCDQHYIFGNNTCVATCPCNFKTFSNFCFEYSGGDFSRAITEVTVPANTSNGTITTIHVLIDQNLLKDSSGNLLEFIPRYTGVRGDQRQHDVQPTVELSIMVNFGNISTSQMFTVNLVNSSSLARCDGTDYRIQPLQFNLVSSSFYQLGEHIINIRGSVFAQNQLEFATQLVVNVETNITCTDEPNNLIHLPNQQCVSECPCGFVPFRDTTTPYCEPAGMARPARLGDDQLRIVVEVGTTINETIILYTNSMFLIVEEAAIPIIPGFDRNILFRSTDSVTVMLRVEQVSSSTLQPSLQFDNELDQSLNISLSNNNLSSRGLEECDEEPNSYIPINIIVPGVSEAGQYRFDIVARFTSTVNETEENLRLNNRFVNVTHALRVDLEVTSITPTIVSTTMLTSTTSVSPTSSPDPDPDLADQVIVVLSIEIFTLEKRRIFQEIVASTVNMHCQSNQDECRNKRQAVTVQANDVVITKVMNVSKGVQLHFYVNRMEGGVIPPGTVVNAVEANLQPFADNNITVVDIMEADPLPVTSPSAGPPVGAIIGGVVGSLIVIAIIIAVILVVLLVTCKLLHNNNDELPHNELELPQREQEERVAGQGGPIAEQEELAAGLNVPADHEQNPEQAMQN